MDFGASSSLDDPILATSGLRPARRVSTAKGLMGLRMQNSDAGYVLTANLAAPLNAAARLRLRHASRAPNESRFILDKRFQRAGTALALFWPIRFRARARDRARTARRRA